MKILDVEFKDQRDFEKKYPDLRIEMAMVLNFFDGVGELLRKGLTDYEIVSSMPVNRSFFSLFIICPSIFIVCFPPFHCVVKVIRRPQEGQCFPGICNLCSVMFIIKRQMVELLIQNPLDRAHPVVFIEEAPFACKIQSL